MKRTILNNIAAACLLFGLFLATACKNDDLTVGNGQQTAVRPLGDFIKNNYDLSLLYAALQKTGLADSLNEKGPFTMWCPDNLAFNGLGIARPSDLDNMNVDSLRATIKYLLLPGRIYISNLPTQLDTKYLSLSGGLEFVSVLSNNTPNADAFTVTINGVTVDQNNKRNIALQNGVLHLVDVMPKYFPGTVQDFVAKDTALRLFAAFMKQGKLWDSLKLTGPYTVYAPTNKAFLQNGLTEDSIAKLDPSQYNRLLFSIYSLDMQPHHLFNADINLIGGYSQQSIQIGPYAVSVGSQVYMRGPDGLLTHDGPGTAYCTDGDRGKDNMVDNGIVFHIDNILLSPQSLKNK